jgi:hypothetical protein
MNRHWIHIGAALVGASLAIGCDNSGTAKKPDSTPPSRSAPEEKSAVGDHHDHVHGAGPHGGTLSDWGGGKYHVEFTVDHDAREATVYILGEDEKTLTPIKAADGEIQLSIRDPAFQLALKAAPREGDPEGSASRFSGRHENLKTVREFAGTISGEIDGTPYAGDFAEEPHEE